MTIRYALIDDLDEITAIEAACFPPGEAGTREAFEQRLTIFPNHFWVLEEKDRIVSVINGLTTNLPNLTDEMFFDASINEDTGDWLMILGVCTIPEYEGKGCASILMKQMIEDVKAEGRKGIVLTCKDRLIPYYEKFGFANEGKSESKLGGAVWYDMRFVVD